jgi:anaerobic magnesium-protoporphyrin IX monomethyl ester cyclase
MRILLINPTITSRRSSRFPLSLLSLAASLQGRCESQIIDGNLDRDYLQTIRRTLREKHFDAVGVSVMGGPQVRTAIDASKTIREVSPNTSIIWGGYFPSLYTKAAMTAPYIDYAVRGQGEGVFEKLLEAIASGERHNLEWIDGLSWRRHGEVINNKDQPFGDRRTSERLPYELLPNPRNYLAHTFMGRRTAAHQAAVGCRFRCTFCGVAGMFRGATALPPAARLERDLLYLRDRLGADSIQYFDHNFFDREVDMIPLLEVMARVELPWWCYARADALIDMSASTWALVRKSKMRMAYIGAESPNDALLKSIRKGTKSNQVLEVADLCRHQGVIPELSFMVAPPNDPEGETERTFEFIREVKRVNPQSEIIVYIYTPLPPEALPVSARVRAASETLRDLNGSAVVFPKTVDEWTEKRWVDYSCHADAPWMSERLRRRIRDFVTVLGCRFPTVQDARAKPWTRSASRALAAWRYRFRRYDQPLELDLWKRMVKPRDPKVASI